LTNTICNQKQISVNDWESKILDYFSTIYVLEKLLDLAIEYLEKEEKEDDERYFGVR
jgi:hypothetical protein